MGNPLVNYEVKSIGKDGHPKIYPNFAADFVTRENRPGESDAYFMQVVDLQPWEIWREVILFSDGFRLDISSLKSGAYLLTIQN